MKWKIVCISDVKVEENPSKIKFQDEVDFLLLTKVEMHSIDIRPKTLYTVHQLWQYAVFCLAVQLTLTSTDNRELGYNTKLTQLC